MAKSPTRKDTPTIILVRVQHWPFFFGTFFGVLSFLGFVVPIVLHRHLLINDFTSSIMNPIVGWGCH